MRERSSGGSLFGVGLITIITVLLVLTLSIFSALSLATARADLALSRINAKTVQAYYDADRTAVGRYAAFAAGDETSLEEMIPIDGEQFLHLSLSRIPTGSQAGGVSIDHWEVVHRTPDESEIQDEWDLWDGGESQ